MIRRGRVKNGPAFSVSLVWQAMDRNSFSHRTEQKAYSSAQPFSEAA